MHKRPTVCSAAWFLLALVLSGPGCSQDNQRTPGPPMLIVPHMSVGVIRAGMTLEQLVSELGEPRKKTANAYDYPQLGLAVMPKEGAVIAVICGDVTGINGAYVKVFNGRTREGIGLRSTRDEVLKVYGEPTKMTGEPGGLQSMRYDNVGITFNLEGGKVHHMIILLDGQEGAPPQQPDDSIKLNLGTPSSEPGEDKR